MSESIITPEYQARLEQLAKLLCPLTETVEVIHVSDRGHGWDSEGRYI